MRELAPESLRTELCQVPVRSEREALALRFPGSPTIRINGSDVESESACSYGLACRLYGNRTGLPTEAAIRTEKVAPDPRAGTFPRRPGDLGMASDTPEKRSDILSNYEDNTGTENSAVFLVEGKDHLIPFEQLSPVRNEEIMTSDWGARHRLLCLFLSARAAGFA
jgi:hypothetical protein